MGYHINNVDLLMSSFVWTAPVVYVWFSNIRTTWVVILLYFQYYTFCTQRIIIIRVVVVVVVMVVLVVVVVGGSNSGGEAEIKKTNITMIVSCHTHWCMLI